AIYGDSVRRSGFRTHEEIAPVLEEIRKGQVERLLQRDTETMPAATIFLQHRDVCAPDGFVELLDETVRFAGTGVAIQNGIRMEHARGCCFDLRGLSEAVTRFIVPPEESD